MLLQQQLLVTSRLKSNINKPFQDRDILEKYVYRSYAWEVLYVGSTLKE